MIGLTHKDGETFDQFAERMFYSILDEAKSMFQKCPDTDIPKKGRETIFAAFVHWRILFGDGGPEPKVEPGIAKEWMEAANSV